MIRVIDGFYFDTSTGKVLDEDGNFLGYTFENQSNPFQFATQETAEKVLALVSKWAPGISFSVGPMKLPVLGQYSWNPRMIHAVSPGTGSAEFNAGLIASSVLRVGPYFAKQAFLADLGTAFKKEE